MRSRLSDKRYEHTLNVKKMAVKLAKIYGEDEERAALAALLHDSAKEISKDEMREILRAYPQYAEGGEERPAPAASRSSDSSGSATASSSSATSRSSDSSGKAAASSSSATATSNCKNCISDNR